MMSQLQAEEGAPQIGDGAFTLGGIIELCRFGVADSLVSFGSGPYLGAFDCHTVSISDLSRMLLLNLITRYFSGLHLDASFATATVPA
jgi:hypothetical protein